MIRSATRGGRDAAGVCSRSAAGRRRACRCRPARPSRAATGQTEADDQHQRRGRPRERRGAAARPAGLVVVGRERRRPVRPRRTARLSLRRDDRDPAGDVGGGERAASSAGLSERGRRGAGGCQRPAGHVVQVVGHTARTCRGLQQVAPSHGAGGRPPPSSPGQRAVSAAYRMAAAPRCRVAAARPRLRPRRRARPRPPPARPPSPGRAGAQHVLRLQAQVGQARPGGRRRVPRRPRGQLRASPAAAGRRRAGRRGCWRRPTR